MVAATVASILPFARRCQADVVEAAGLFGLDATVKALWSAGPVRLCAIRIAAQAAAFRRFVRFCSAGHSVDAAYASHRPCGGASRPLSLTCAPRPEDACADVRGGSDP